ncbi:MAG: hypothetical protein M3340_16660 [Actinomycetota bacterium]|nr:hypothetical protein [Actinomycetota bacterium]
MEHGGLEPQSWDLQLVDELHRKLGLGAGDVGEALERADVPTETFVVEFFAAMAPFAEMLEDLLQLFEEQGVTQTDRVVQIEFDFGAEADKLRFDLESFRTAHTTWTRAHRRVAAPEWTHDEWWQLRTLLLGDALGYSSGDDPPELLDFKDQYMSGRWPERVPPAPVTDNPRLDTQLELARLAGQSFIRIGRELGADRQVLNERLDAGRRPGPEGDPEQTDPRVEPIGQADTDHYALGLMQAVYVAAARARSGEDVEEAAARLEAFFDAHPLPIVEIEELVEELLDVLQLPIWKHRYDLYAAWVLSEIVAALPAGARLVTPERGVLRFPFSPTPMAQIAGCREEITVWSELRSPLSDPLGSSRQANVQPDYSIVVAGAAPEPGPETSILEVECKQYKTPVTRSFAAALRDYAKARPNAVAVLVSHGRANADRIVAAVPEEQRDRTRVIGELHPGNPPARDAFARCVGEQLDRLCPKPQPTPAVADASAADAASAPAVMRCSLSWDAPPRDLDLHLTIDGGDGATTVSYRSPGSLDAPPFAQLLEDVREPGGRETIVVSRWLDGMYRFAVHAYSDDGELARSGARAVLEFDDGSSFELRCPETVAGRWWDLAEIGPGGPPVTRNALR